MDRHHKNHMLSQIATLAHGCIICTFVQVYVLKDGVHDGATLVFCISEAPCLHMSCRRTFDVMFESLKPATASSRRRSTNPWLMESMTHDPTAIWSEAQGLRNLHCPFSLSALNRQQTKQHSVHVGLGPGPSQDKCCKCNKHINSEYFVGPTQRKRYSPRANHQLSKCQP